VFAPAVMLPIGGHLPVRARLVRGARQVGRREKAQVVSTATEDHPKELDRVVIRFAGDSGDGMQLTGTQFTTVSSLFGNGTATLPDFPAEIRAPAGTLAGVSAFQVHISDHDILTPGDAPNVLVAMNPAALRANLGSVASGGSFSPRKASLMKSSHLSSAVGTRSGMPQKSAVRRRSKLG